MHAMRHQASPPEAAGFAPWPVVDDAPRGGDRPRKDAQIDIQWPVAGGVIMLSWPLAAGPCAGAGGLAQGFGVMIRIDGVWLALGASDLRGGIDVLLGAVVRNFEGGAQPHHAYVFANRRADRLKVLVYDGAGLWLCTRRLQSGGFAWSQQAGQVQAISREQLDWLMAGLPWQRVGVPAQAITLV